MKKIHFLENFIFYAAIDYTSNSIPFLSSVNFLSFLSLPFSMCSIESELLYIFLHFSFFITVVLSISLFKLYHRQLYFFSMAISVSHLTYYITLHYNPDETQKRPLRCSCNSIRIHSTVKRRE